MAEPLTPERFAALAEAYGGAIARWPEDVRVEATLMASRDPALRDLLDRADALDALLDRWRVPAPSPTLATAIASRSPRPTRRRRLWWSSIGIATALAGAAAGSIAVASTTPAAAVHDETTAFGDLTES